MRLGLSDSVCHHEPVSEEQEKDAASTVVKVFSGGFFQNKGCLLYSSLHGKHCLCMPCCCSSHRLCGPFIWAYLSDLSLLSPVFLFFHLRNYCFGKSSGISNNLNLWNVVRVWNIHHRCVTLSGDSEGVTHICAWLTWRSSKQSASPQSLIF